MYQALYRKYRPSSFDEVVGQKVIVKTLKNAIKYDKISHAYLFCGPRGTGKTSIAKILAKTVNCSNLNDYLPCDSCVNCLQFNSKQSVDIIEIDAASNNGVDEIRELRDKVNLVPSFGKYKIYIIDEVHMLTTSAFNALLKTLEEPPKHVIFVLATTEPYKIPITILSRCQRFDFKRISIDDIIDRLEKIAENEKINISREILREIALLSDGGMRDSVNLLDQVNAYADEKIELKDVHDVNGTLLPNEIYDLVNKMLNNQLKEALILSDEYNDGGKNMVKILEEMISFFRNILIAKLAPEYLGNNSFADYYNNISTEFDIDQINEIMKKMNDTLYEMRISNNPKILFDLLVLTVSQMKNKCSKNISREIISGENAQEKAVNEDEMNKFFSNNINSQTKTDIKEVKPIKKIVIDREVDEKKEKLKDLRINNTLACFDKMLLKEVKDKLPEVRNYILDVNYNFVASLVIDGVLKAAGANYLIFVYNNVHDSDIFNDNLDKIELLFETLYNKKYKVISTSIDAWEIIRDDFNKKKKVYTFIKEEEKVKVENTNADAVNEIENDFGDLISVE